MPALASIPTPLRVPALVVCLSLATSLAPQLALAGPEPGSAETRDAESIFRQGQVKYETADYNGAIELWTEAYGLVDSTPENASIKALLIFNLAQAHIKAFDLDEDPIHLKQAKSLLTSYGDNLALIYEDEEALAGEQGRVDEKVAEIDAKLAALREPEPEPEPEPESEPPPPQVEPQDPVDRPLPPTGTPLIAAGGALLGLGVGAGVLGLVGGLIGANANDISGLDFDDTAGREDQFARGRAGNTLLVVGAVAAGVLVPTGAALIGVGIKRNNQRNNRASASMRLSPTFGGAWGSGAGLSLSGQF